VRLLRFRMAMLGQQSRDLAASPAPRAAGLPNGGIPSADRPFSPGWRKSTPVSSVMAYHSLAGEAEGFKHLHDTPPTSQTIPSFGHSSGLGSVDGRSVDSNEARGSIPRAQVGVLDRNWPIEAIECSPPGTLRGKLSLRRVREVYWNQSGVKCMTNLSDRKVRTPNQAPEAVDSTRISDATSPAPSYTPPAIIRAHNALPEAGGGLGDDADSFSNPS